MTLFSQTFPLESNSQRQCLGRALTQMLWPHPMTHRLGHCGGPANDSSGDQTTGCGSGTVRRSLPPRICEPSSKLMMSHPRADKSSHPCLLGGRPKRHGTPPPRESRTLACTCIDDRRRDVLERGDVNAFEYSLATRVEISRGCDAPPTRHTAQSTDRVEHRAATSPTARIYERRQREIMIIRNEQRFLTGGE